MYILSKGTRDFIPTSQRDQDSPITFQITPPTRKVVLQGQAMMQKAILKSGVQLPTSNEDTLDIEAIGLDMSISCRTNCICPPGAEHKCTERRDIPGSVAFVPSVAGLIIAGEVVKDIAGK